MINTVLLLGALVSMRPWIRNLIGAVSIMFCLRATSIIDIKRMLDSVTIRTEIIDIGATPREIEKRVSEGNGSVFVLDVSSYNQNRRRTLELYNVVRRLEYRAGMQSEDGYYGTVVMYSDHSIPCEMRENVCEMYLDEHLFTSTNCVKDYIPDPGTYELISSIVNKYVSDSDSDATRSLKAAAVMLFAYCEHKGVSFNNFLEYAEHMAEIGVVNDDLLSEVTEYLREWVAAGQEVYLLPTIPANASFEDELFLFEDELYMSDCSFEKVIEPLTSFTTSMAVKKTLAENGVLKCETDKKMRSWMSYRICGEKAKRRIHMKCIDLSLIWTSGYQPLKNYLIIKEEE